MEPRFLVYALAEPWTGDRHSGEIRYVGKSSLGMARPRARHSAHCGAWMAKLKRRGLGPSVVVLQEFSDEAPLELAERFWIAELRRRGCPLTNLTDGGEGVRGHAMSGEARAKIAAALRGRTRPPDVVAKVSAALKGRPGPWLGKKRSAETIEKMKAVRGEKHHSFGKPRPQHVLDAIRAANIGRRLSDEHRSKLSSAKRGRPLTAEHRVRIGVAQLGAKRSDESRLRMSEAAKKREALKRRRAAGIGESP